MKHQKAVYVISPSYLKKVTTKILKTFEFKGRILHISMKVPEFNKCEIVHIISN